MQLLWGPLVVLVIFPSLIRSNIISFPFQTVQNCTKKQYFDIAQVTCARCGAQQQTSSDGTSCVCLPGYHLTSNKGGPSITCKKCPGQYPAVTQDGWNCIRCPSNAIMDNHGKCQCPTGHILVERTITGTLLREAICVTCDVTGPSFSSPDLLANRCIRCHETFINTTQSCDCQTNILTGGLCFLRYPLGLTSSVVTNIIYEQGLQVSSAWFATHLKASAIACLRFANLTACQALGNMCVMIMNSIDKAIVPNDACTLHKIIFMKTINLGITHSISSWRKNLPWLYYDSQYGLASRNLDQIPFPKVFHFKSSHRMELQLIIAKYDARGYFLNWEKVIGGTLQLCPDSITKLNATYTFGTTYQQRISFSVEYNMHLTTAYQNTKIALGFLSGLSAICSVLKTASWKRRIGSPMIDIPTVWKFLLFYAGDLANAFFIVTFGTGLYWLTFFKGQQIVSVVLPTPSQESYFISCVASAFALKLLQLLHKLAHQLTVDIFFIDWERPKGKIIKSVAGGGDIKTAPAPVSIWRTYFVANEWNNIQTIRKINPNFQIIAVLFFLEVVGFKNLTSMDPYSNLNKTAESNVAPSSRILRYGIANSIWLTVGLIQVIFCTSIYERFVDDKISQFIDLCSISNENLCSQRGLVPNTETETFQIFITSKIREQYDKIREPIYWTDVPARVLNSPGDLTENRMRAYNTTNRFLGSFIDHALRDMDYIVQDKLLLERIIGMELHEPIDKTIFYNDENLTFTDVLYYGNEGTLLMFDMLFFSVVDLAAQNFILAALLTYAQQKIIQFIRHALGRKNLAAKTLVDERFLL
uniref:meckelin isoform X4 n=1 Tax=Pristiophorus japonicus TaxID=55135 RepID=UPI00398F5FE8